MPHRNLSRAYVPGAFALAALAIVVAGLSLSGPLTCAADTFEVTPGAAQYVYQQGVPQTDAQGQLLPGYDPQRSFLPIGLYHAVAGQFFGRTYTLAPARELGCNFVHLMEMVRAGKAVAEAQKDGPQLVIHHPPPALVAQFAASDRILGWYLDEEPTGKYFDQDIDAKFAAFQQRMAAIKAVDPVHPVFPLDASTILPPRTEWWLRWNSAGDISSHDNYQFLAGNPNQTINGKRGIPASVSLAVQATGGKKPIWFVVQAHASDGRRGKAVLFCTPAQERCMVYTAFIHGATGIWYFAYDSFFTRAGGVMGLAPDPQADYGGDKPQRLLATPEQIAASAALWQAITCLNRELAELKPALLSPTSPMRYSVSVQGAHTSAAPIRCLLKQVGEDYYLLAANTDGQALEGKFDFPRFFGKTEVMFEDRSPDQVETESLTDHFEPWGVHVYHLTFM